MGNENELAAYAAQSLTNLQNFFAHPIGTKATGGVLGVYSVLSLANFMGKFEGVKQARRHAMTGEMVYRLNLAIVLFVVVVGLGAFLKLSDGDPALTPYNIAYRPLQAVLATITVGLVLFNYGDMIRNAFQKEYKTPLMYRIGKLYEVTSKRGINLFELILIPIVFFIPWQGALAQAAQLLRQG